MANPFGNAEAPEGGTLAIAEKGATDLGFEKGHITSILQGNAEAIQGNNTVAATTRILDHVLSGDGRVTSRVKAGILAAVASDAAVARHIRERLDEILFDDANARLADSSNCIKRLAHASADREKRFKALVGDLLNDFTIDGMTGLWNQQTFRKHNSEIFDRLKKDEEPACFIMFDLDCFHDFNEQYGHSAGDYVLETVGEILRGELRPYDLTFRTQIDSESKRYKTDQYADLSAKDREAIVARDGGEEFAIMVPGATLEQAAAVAERVRKRLEKHHFEYDGQTFPISATFGVAEIYKDDRSPNFKSVKDAADRALYAAKTDRGFGRNAVVTCAISDEGNKSFELVSKKARRIPKPKPRGGSSGDNAPETRRQFSSISSRALLQHWEENDPEGKRRTIVFAESDPNLRRAMTVVFRKFFLVEDGFEVVAMESNDDLGEYVEYNADTIALAVCDLVPDDAGAASVWIANHLHDMGDDYTLHNLPIILKATGSNEVVPSSPGEDALSSAVLDRKIAGYFPAYLSNLDALNVAIATMISGMNDPDPTLAVACRENHVGLIAQQRPAQIYARDVDRLLPFVGRLGNMFGLRDEAPGAQEKETATDSIAFDVYLLLALITEFGHLAAFQGGIGENKATYAKTRAANFQNRAATAIEGLLNKLEPIVHGAETSLAEGADAVVPSSPEEVASLQQLLSCAKAVAARIKDFGADCVALEKGVAHVTEKST